MIDKDVGKSLARKNGNEILIWIWNNPVTGWMLCVVSLIREDVFKNLNINHMIQVNTVIKTSFLDRLRNSCMKPLIHFGVNIQNLIIRMIGLTSINLSRL